MDDPLNTKTRTRRLEDDIIGDICFNHRLRENREWTWKNWLRTAVFQKVLKSEKLKKCKMYFFQQNDNDFSSIDAFCRQLLEFAKCEKKKVYFRKWGIWTWFFLNQVEHLSKWFLFLLSIWNLFKVENLKKDLIYKFPEDGVFPATAS